jgi:OHCU decarboxylase
MTHEQQTRRFNPPPRAMSRQAFVARFGGVYEHSPWVAEGAFDRGLSASEDTPAGLAAAMAAVLAKAGDEPKLALIRAHPDLAGRAAIAGDLTEASRSEQSGAGLDRCTPEEYRRFQALNHSYKRKFGFPFILAVAGKSRNDILAAFEARLGNDPPSEFRTALEQIDRIALHRLNAIASASC